MTSTTDAASQGQANGLRTEGTVSLAHAAARPAGDLLIVIPDAESEADAAAFRRCFADQAPAGIALRVHVGEPGTPAAWAELVADADAIILNWKLPDHALDAAGRLRVVSFLGTGAADHLDLALAEERGIDVRTVSGYSNDAVAEHTLGLLLALARGTVARNRELRAGNWQPETGMQLAGKRLGLIGYGGIGQRVAELGTAFGMEVLAWTRSGRVSGPARSAELVEVLETSDVVSLHLALTPETTGFIDAAALAKLRPGALLVNTARGALVDEAAVLAALESGALGGYATDVFAVEPVAPEHAIVAHPRVVATPHIGYATADAEAELLRRGVANAIAGLDASPTTP
ncbi:D-isomer specific 2-hydroxyacid dehydrogenase family protein [Leucobacter albus]|uniref:D-isomer specific 2-hydroxyacid dehydrogenase family protein n=1 Tax=Leucobacter albus TaxID=272210 RepID=A0ABW3TN64_9MICO